jgi:hypothetical protein
MSPDLRRLLDTGAGQPRDLLDFDRVWRRARRLVWRRRATLALAVATLVVVGIAVLPTLRLPQDRSLPPTAEEPPARTLESGPLAPGRYRLPGFSPPLTLDVHASGWNAELVRPPTWLLLDMDGVNLHLQRWRAIYDPVADLPRQRALPPDLATWLQAHPRLTVTASTRVVIGGLQGRQLDLTVSSPLRRQPRECTRPCALLGRVAGYPEPVDLEADTQARFLVLDAPPGQLVIYFRTTPPQFDRVATQATELLSRLRFDKP